MPSTLQTALSLLAVLALIVAFAWLLRRVQRPAAGNAIIGVRAQLMVGPRERVIVLEIGEQWIVAGVAAGRVTPLAVMPRQAQPPPDVPAAGGSAFAAVLARLGSR